VQEAADLKERLYLEQIQRALPIEPVVQIIRDYSGKLPMAVATGGTRAICLRTLGAMKLVEEFVTIVTADDVVHGKPAPDIFLEAARRLNVAPANCCGFEDGELGLQAVRAAGMHVVDIRKLRKAPSAG